VRQGDKNLNGVFWPNIYTRYYSNALNFNFRTNIRLFKALILILLVVTVLPEIKLIYLLAMCPWKIYCTAAAIRDLVIIISSMLDWGYSFGSICYNADPRFISSVILNFI
jgi:hypothetical protein